MRVAEVSPLDLQKHAVDEGFLPPGWDLAKADLTL